MKTTFPALPRDARDAAAKGFDVGGATIEFEDDFTSGSTILRRGIAYAQDGRGNTIKVPFTANFSLGRPIHA